MTDKDKYLAEIMDPQKVTLYCGTHMYFGPVKGNEESKPAQGCPKCWFVLYFQDIATTPPAMRAARLDELDEVVHKCCELAGSDKFDIDIARHSDVKINNN